MRCRISTKSMLSSNTTDQRSTSTLKRLTCLHPYNGSLKTELYYTHKANRSAPQGRTYLLEEAMIWSSGLISQKKKKLRAISRKGTSRALSFTSM
uniref:Uncharacterized protein n=1 Tax=Brassica campestris TaxID=3711 RepID=A0A3P5ZZU5_BRACM|nr:unnamed protein product [Brassica rapa]